MKALKGTIGELAEKYRFLLSSDNLDDADKASFRQISTRSKDSNDSRFIMGNDILKTSIKTLTGLVQKHYGLPVVVLIDEYDVPLNNAFEGGYYKNFINIYRTLLSSAFKENDSLAFAVVTGCLRISKESIFTGVNNFSTVDVTWPEMDEYFGFSDDEVARMLEHYGLSAYHEKVRGFYDGYRFGSRLAYNSW